MQENSEDSMPFDFPEEASDRLPSGTAMTRRGAIVGSLAALFSTAACSKLKPLSDTQEAAGLGPMAKSDNNAGIVRRVTADGMDIASEGMLESLWNIVESASWKKGSPFGKSVDSVAVSLTSNPVGAIARHLGSHIELFLRGDERVLAAMRPSPGRPATVSKARLDTAVASVRKKYDSTSLYELASSAVSSERRRMLPSMLEELVRERGFVEADFPRLLARKEDDPIDASVLVMYFLWKLHGEPVKKSDLRDTGGRTARISHAGMEAISDLVRRLDFHTRTIYRRAGMDTGGFIASWWLPVSGVLSLIGVSSGLDLWQASDETNLNDNYERARKKITTLLEKDRQEAELRLRNGHVDDSRYKKHGGDPYANARRMEALALETKTLHGLLGKIDVFKARIEPENPLVLGIYGSYRRAIDLVLESDDAKELTPSQKLSLRMAIDSMVAEQLFLNATFFGSFFSRLAGAGVLQWK